MAKTHKWRRHDHPHHLTPDKALKERHKSEGDIEQAKEELEELSPKGSTIIALEPSKKGKKPLK